MSVVIAHKTGEKPPIRGSVAPGWHQVKGRYKFTLNGTQLPSEQRKGVVKSEGNIAVRKEEPRVEKIATREAREKREEKEGTQKGVGVVAAPHPAYWQPLNGPI